ncbi:YadA-like family protein [Kluyvera georgiana]|uniref:YadA C-terminal domain-containing protein n=1 Tax=Kluyvera georgiana TaxID=73098 RepID=UPI003F67D337
MQSVSKSIIAVAVLTAISSSNAIAQQVGVDQTDPYGLGSYTIVGTPNQAYDLDKMQQDAQVAADAKVTADKANADILKMGKQVEDNRLDAGTNSVRIKHLETEASVLNGQAVQLRQDVNINTKALSVLGGNVQQLQGQIGNFVTKPEFKTDQDRQDDAITDVSKIATDAKDLAEQNYQAIAKKADLADLLAETQRASDAEKINADNLTKAITDQAKVDAGQDKLIKQNGDDIQQNATDIKLKADQSDLDDTNKKVADNAKAITTKVETTAFTADQQRQDDALNMVVAAQKTIDDDQNKEIQQNTSNIALKANQIDLDTTNKAVADNKTAAATAQSTADVAKQQADTNKADIQTNKTAIGTKVDQTKFKIDQDRQDQIVTTLTNTVNSKANQADVDANKQAIAADETNITANKAAIDTEVKAEQQHFSTLSSGVQQAQTTGDAAQNRADIAFANAEANHRALVNTNQHLADDEKTLANHEQRISDLEANNRKNFNKLEQQQNKDRKEFRAGLAGAFALTAIPQAPQGHTVGFGMGVGTFNGQNAVSAGISARVSANVSLKTGLSWDTADNVGAGAGVLFSY